MTFNPKQLCVISTNRATHGSTAASDIVKVRRN